MCGHGLCHLASILNQSAIINALGPKALGPNNRQCAQGNSFAKFDSVNYFRNAEEN